MRCGLKMLSAGFVLTFALGTTGVVHAAPEANTNQCWGDIAGQLAQRGQMGQHSSSHSVFTPDPGEGGRNGVARQGIAVGAGEPGDGGNGRHAILVGSLVGTLDPVTGQPGEPDPILCDGTPGNPPPDTP